jgi:hypothetical protein
MFSFLRTNFRRDKRGVPDSGMPVTCLDLSAKYSKQTSFILHDIFLLPKLYKKSPTAFFCAKHSPGMRR